MVFSEPDNENSFYADHVHLLLDSYQHFSGRTLLNSQATHKTNIAEQVFYADFALVSHNTAQDPVFNYANHTALMLFEFPWQEFINLPSRFSAEPVNHTERERLLAKVSEKGFIEHYQGLRVAKSGKRFKINNATIWNVYNSDNEYHGQAACFSDWFFV